MQKRRPCITVIGLSGHSIFMGVDHFPSAGETVLCHRLQMEPGGKGYNQAIGCARLGADTRFISAVGDDDTGRQCLQILESEQIDTTWIRRIHDKETAVAVIQTDAAGENQVTVYPGAGNSLKAEDIYAAESAFSGCDVVLVQLELDLACLKAAIVLAKKHRAKVVLNPAPAQALGPDLLGSIDWLTPNHQEALLLAGQSFQAWQPDLTDSNDLEQISQNQVQILKKIAGEIRRPVTQLLNEQSKPPGIIVTLGADGAYLFEDENKYFPPFRQTLVKDTTGAGDTFNAAFATRIAMNRPPEEAVRFAMAAAALSVRTHGVINAIPFESAVLEYLRISK